MDSVSDILSAAISDGTGRRYDNSRARQISDAVGEKLVFDVVTTVLYEEIEEEIANG